MDIQNLEKWHFARTADDANALLKLVLAGEKKATSSSLLGYKENEPLPKAGDISVITDWDGTPGCVVKTTQVRILPYKKMTYDLAKLEGEDDTLDSWQKKHIAFWIAEGKEEGYAFSEDMPVIFEEFEVLEVL